MVKGCKQFQNLLTGQWIDTTWWRHTTLPQRSRFWHLLQNWWTLNPLWEMRQSNCKGNMYVSRSTKAHSGWQRLEGWEETSDNGSEFPLGLWIVHKRIVLIVVAFCHNNINIQDANSHLKQTEEFIFFVNISSQWKFEKPATVVYFWSLALGRLRKENGTFKASWSYTIKTLSKRKGIACENCWAIVYPHKEKGSLEVSKVVDL